MGTGLWRHWCDCLSQKPGKCTTGSNPAAHWAIAVSAPSSCAFCEMCASVRQIRGICTTISQVSSICCVHNNAHIIPAHLHPDHCNACWHLYLCFCRGTMAQLPAAVWVTIGHLADTGTVLQLKMKCSKEAAVRDRASGAWYCYVPVAGGVSLRRS
jgi:hypothetical protein